MPQRQLTPLEHYSQPIVDAWKACIASAQSNLQIALQKIEEKAPNKAVREAAVALEQDIVAAKNEPGVADLRDGFKDALPSLTPEFKTDDYKCMGDYYNCALAYGQFRCVSTYIFCLTDALLP